MVVLVQNNKKSILAPDVQTAASCRPDTAHLHKYNIYCSVTSVCPKDKYFEITKMGVTLDSRSTSDPALGV